MALKVIKPASDPGNEQNAMTFDDDKQALLEAIKAETKAYLDKDIEALSQYWVQSPYARRMVSVANLGTYVIQGWEAIRENYIHLIEQFPEKHPVSRIHWEKLNVNIRGDMAWITYNEVGDKADDNFEMAGTLHQLKVFERHDGRWKMACIVVMQRAVDHVSYPIIEIDSDKTVKWMNAQAHEHIINHPTLVISGGRLRALNRVYETGLQDAVDWASRSLLPHWTKEPLERPARAVILAESDDAAPLFCWVLIDDGKILVSFNDDQLVKRRVDTAQSIFGLSTAQTQLATLLAQGNDLALASEKLGISINTVRTHLQRMFDRTGARTQSALVGIILSAEAPGSG